MTEPATTPITASPYEQYDDFPAYRKCCAERVETFLKFFLETLSQQQASEGRSDTLSAAPLYEAVQYAIFNGGKRLRPLLVYAVGEALEAPLEQLHTSAAAVELIHCFSLVHDDLPAMDNDDFRRGKPTCHKVFGEAIAILAGDALQSLSFELLSERNLNPLPLESQMKIIRILSKATGIHGMVGGQALDIAAVDSMQRRTKRKGSIELDKGTIELDKAEALEELVLLHRKKTGVLISASVSMGLAASQCQDENIIAGLGRYADLLGLGFQVQDDILDVEGSLETLGKTPEKDTKLDKLTFPAILGLEGAKKYKKKLQLQLLETLQALPLAATHRLRLERIASFFLDRQY